MKNTYLEKSRAAQEAIIGEIIDERLDAFDESQKCEALLMLGRAQAADRIATALSAQVIRCIEYFEESKLYRALGYDRFVDFLANCGLSGVTKSKYYERKKILDREGDPLFDALSAAGVPIQIRGLLKPGEVTIEGDNIVIGGETESSATVIHREDSASIVQSLRNLGLTRQTAYAERDAAKQEITEIRTRHDAEKRELYDEIDRARAATAAEVSGDRHSVALANLCFAFAAFREQISELSDADRDVRRHRVLEILADQMGLTADAYGAGNWTAAINAGSMPAKNGKSATGIGEWFGEKFNSIDLDADNESELVAKM